jgi:hypothetical protein
VVQQTAHVKVHHLNCGTLYPFGCGEMVCHVLLVETGNGLMLIDTGFGPKDCDDPTRRVGASRYHMPRALAAFETVTAFDRKMMRQNHARLTELYRRREPDMLMVCSHDRTLYEQAKATT